jgi:hypothetical protein
MFPGEKLTDFTSEELDVLLDAVKSYTVDFRIERIASGSTGKSKVLDTLSLWSVKIIEAKAHVITQERVNQN